jgi:hypothetical protein
MWELCGGLQTRTVIHITVFGFRVEIAAGGWPNFD